MTTKAPAVAVPASHMRELELRTEPVSTNNNFFRQTLSDMSLLPGCAHQLLRLRGSHVTLLPSPGFSDSWRDALRTCDENLDSLRLSTPQVDEQLSTTNRVETSRDLHYKSKTRHSNVPRTTWQHSGELPGACRPGPAEWKHLCYFGHCLAFPMWAHAIVPDDHRQCLGHDPSFGPARPIRTLSNNTACVIPSCLFHQTGRSPRLWTKRTIDTGPTRMLCEHGNRAGRRLASRDTATTPIVLGG